ncbi:hypothetical protein PF002_g13967 [Phytophthora fragariae]|uniref:Uncharacterized protein n=1 Tax=Phytophthora fragariae TaxID=53985 RepID=A0A6A3YZY0_9STRA|nr:hypothetical protein PF002_g13967 [Phytophthora fragariae]
MGAALSMRKLSAMPLSAQCKFSFVVRPRFYRRCVTTPELTDNVWTHTMDINDYAHLMVHHQQSARVICIRVIVARPQRVDIQPREELHELQFAPTGQNGDPQQARANVQVHHVTGACYPQSTARRRTVAPSGSWTSTASPWLRDDSNTTSYDVCLGKRRQPTTKVLITLRVKFVKFVPGRGEPLLAEVDNPHTGGKSGVGMRLQRATVLYLDVVQASFHFPLPVMHRFSRCSLVCPCACATPSCTPRHSQAQSSFLFFLFTSTEQSYATQDGPSQSNAKARRTCSRSVTIDKKVNWKTGLLVTGVVTSSLEL